MTLKISKAFIFSGVPFDKAVLLLGSKASAIQALVDAAQSKLLAARLTTLVDQVSLSFVGKVPQLSRHAERLSRSAWDVAVEDLLTEQRALRRSFDPDPEVHCDVELRLFASYEARQLMGYSKQGRADAFALLQTLPSVQEYAWHTGSPRAGLSEEAWATRGHAWQTAMAPATGFSFQQYWAPGPAQPESVVAQVPTTEQRALGLAQERVLASALSKAYAEGSRVPRVRLERELGIQLNESGSPLFAQAQTLAKEFMGVLHPSERFAHLIFEKMTMLVPAYRGANTSIPPAAEVAQYVSILEAA